MDKIIKNEILNEEMHVRKLSSGIKCYIIPKKGYVEKQAILATKYGAIDINFSVDNESFSTPHGVAHFLEHKVFEDEELNLFDQFAQIGGNVNAFTNYNNTAYYFSCSDNFEQNFELLLDFVFKPYLTDENIEKEKGIIAQEINMYSDYPSWKCYFNMQSAMYKELPVKYDIAGTVESIQEIDKEVLLKCFDAFYQPENMVIICSGDFDIDNIYKTIDKKIQKGYSKKIIRNSYEEPKEVGQSFIEQKMSVSIPLFNLGFKDNNIEDDKGLLIAKSKILLDIIAGESSPIYEKMYNEGIIDNSFSIDYSCGIDYGISVFSGNSIEPQKVSNEIIKEVKRISKEGIDKARFEQIKRKHIGSYVRSFNSINTITTMQLDFETKGTDLFGIMDSFNKLTVNMLNQRLKDHLDTDNYVLSVVAPI